MPSEVSEVREQLVAVTITGEGAFIDSERIEPPDEDADLQDVVLDAVTHRFAEPSGKAVRVIAWDGHALMTFMLRPNGTTSEIVPVYVGDRLAQAYAFRTIGIPRPEPQPGFFARLRQGLSRPRKADAGPESGPKDEPAVESKIDLEKAAAAATVAAAAEVPDGPEEPDAAVEPDVEPDSDIEVQAADEPADEPVAEVELAPEPVAEVDAEVEAEPLAETPDEPVAEAEPVAESAVDAEREPVAETVSEPVDEPVVEPVVEPVAEAVDAPVADAVDERVAVSPDLPATDLVEAVFGPPDPGPVEDADEMAPAGAEDDDAVAAVEGTADVPAESAVDDEFSWAAFAKSLDTPYGVFSEPDVSDVPPPPELSPPETPRKSPFAGLGSFKTAGELAGDMSDELEFQPEFGPEFQSTFAAHGPVAEAPTDEPATFVPADWSTEGDAFAGDVAVTEPDVETEPEVVPAADTDAPAVQELDEGADEPPVPIFYTPVEDRRRRKGALIAVLVVGLIGLFSAGAWALIAGGRGDSPADTALSTSPSATETAPVSQAPAAVTSPPAPLKLTTKVKGGHGRVDAIVTLPGKATTLVSLVIAYTDAGGDQRYLRQSVRLKGGTPTRVSLNDVRPGNWEWWVKGDRVATAHGKVKVLANYPPATPESTPSPASTSESTPVNQPTDSPSSTPTSQPTSPAPTGPVDPGSSSPPPTGPVPGG